jgi:hypothetical protein
VDIPARHHLTKKKGKKEKQIETKALFDGWHYPTYRKF